MDNIKGMWNNIRGMWNKFGHNNLIKEAFESLRPDNRLYENGNRTSSANKGRSKVTNKILYDELLEHFETEMDNLTIGKRILYPMSFNILLHPDDYKRVGESLPYILPEVISGFYAAIKKKKEQVGDDANATNPATYWFFQFASSTIKTQHDEESFIVPGEVVTVGHLTTFDINKVQQCTRIANVKLSVKCKNSNVNDNNINQESLLGMDIITNNAFMFNFDKSMSEDVTDIHSSRRGEKSGLATISYSDGSHNIHYSMVDELIIISGRSETRNLDNIFIVNSESVDVGHVQIRYNKDTRKFQLCAYAKTRLNTQEVPISVGGVAIWKDMSYKSEIFMNDEVSLKFEASESIMNHR